MRFYPEIRLKTNGTTVTDITINGHKINGVRSVTFSADVDSIPTVLLELNALDTEIEGKMEAIVAALEGKEEGEDNADVSSTGES